MKAAGRIGYMGPSRAVWIVEYAEHISIICKQIPEEVNSTVRQSIVAVTETAITLEAMSLLLHRCSMDHVMIMWKHEVRFRMKFEETSMVLVLHKQRTPAKTQLTRGTSKEYGILAFAMFATVERVSLID